MTPCNALNRRAKVAPATCLAHVHVDIGRTVLTAITAHGVPLSGAAPVTLMTLEVACTIVGIARQTARNALWLHRDRFDCLPHPYMPNGARILTPRDLDTLKAMFPLRAGLHGAAKASRKK